MAIFYFPRDRRFDLEAPQVTRTRHYYNGSRESEKINLEMNQFYLASKHILDRSNDLRSSFQDKKDTVYDGGELSGVTLSDSTAIIVEGLIDMYSRVDRMRDRVRYLEVHGNG